MKNRGWKRGKEEPGSDGERPARSRGQQVLALAALLALALVVAGCGAAAGPGEVAVETVSLQALYPDALAQAQQWRADAYLVGAETPFWIAGGGPGEARAGFSFRSPSSDASRLVVEYDLGTGLFENRWEAVTEEEKEGEQAIAQDEWPVNSVDALETAEAQGGAQFLFGRSSGNLDLAVRLLKGPRGGSWITIWSVDYFDPESKETFSVAIDATSGAVIGKAET